MSVSRTFVVRLWFMAPCLPTQYTEHEGDQLLNSRELKSKVSSTLCLLWIACYVAFVCCGAVCDVGCSTMNASDWQAVGPHASFCLMVLSQHQSCLQTRHHSSERHWFYPRNGCIIFPSWLPRRKSHDFTSVQGILWSVVHLCWVPWQGWFYKSCHTA